MQRVFLEDEPKSSVGYSVVTHVVIAAILALAGLAVAYLCSSLFLRCVAYCALFTIFLFLVFNSFIEWLGRRWDRISRGEEDAGERNCDENP